MSVAIFFLLLFLSASTPFMLSEEIWWITWSWCFFVIDTDLYGDKVYSVATHLMLNSGVEIIACEDFYYLLTFVILPYQC